MTSADFSPFAVATKLENYSASLTRPPRVRAYSFPPCVCHIYFESFRVVIGLKPVLRLSPRLPALCDFCSSDQRFAYTFLQTPPHDGRPWCSAMPFPLLGQATDFHRLEYTHAGHTIKIRGKFPSDFYFRFYCQL